MKTPSTLRSWKAAVWILVFAALFASRIMQIVDHDVFLHARSGWWMIEQRTFPRTDPFSLLAGGERWVNHQWLAQILIALGSAKAIGGFATLGLIRAALATLSYFLIFLAMRERSAGVWPALIALITGALAAWRYSEPRPYIITYVMMAWIAWAWAAWKARRSRAIYWTPALMIVWANCHGGFTAGLAFLGALAAGQTLEYGVPPLGGGKRQVSWLPQPPLTNRLKAGLRAGVREAGPIWAVLFASGAAALLNPNGVLLYTVPLKVMGVRLFEQSVFEWNPPAFEYDFWPYYIYLAMLAAAFAARPRAAGAADWIAALGFGWMSLTSRRHIPLLVYSTAPVLAQLLRDWRAEVGKTGIGPLVWEKRRPARLSGRGSQTPPAAIDRESAPVSRFPAPRSLEFLRRRIPLPYLRELVVAALILAGAHWTYRMLAFKYIPWGLGVYSLAQPRKAVDFIERAGLKPNLFNGYNWGGYVAWRLFPAWKTFIDGRVDLYGPERVKEYYSWITGTGDWRGAFERFGIQTVLLDYQQARGKLGRQLWQSPEWALVYWDDIGVVYARPSPETQAAVEAHAFHAFNPAWSYAEAVDALPAGPKRETALAELKEQLAHDPRSIRALDFESYFDSIDGRLDEAAELCRRMIALQPRGATAYARLATILDKQRDLDGAERAYRMTLRLQPRMADAWVRLGAMYERRGDSKTALRYYQRALQVRPGDLDGLYNAARVSANLGRDRESLRLWERYLSVKPGEPDLLQGVADLYRQIGDEVDAWRLLSSTSSTSPTSSTLSASTPGFSLRSGALSPTISKTKETASFRA